MNLWEAIYLRHKGNLKDEPSLTPPSHLSTWFGQGVISGSASFDPIDVRNEIENDSSPEETKGEPDIAPVDERTFAEQNQRNAVERHKQNGMEAIAFFAPMHYYGIENWGIYLNEPVFYGMCSRLAEILPSAKWNELVLDFYKAVEQHEMFHAAVELYCLVGEDFADMGFKGALYVYKQLDSKDKSQIIESNPPCWYKPYHENCYRKNFPTENCIEEVLATTAESFCDFKVNGMRDALKQIQLSAPAAYQCIEECPDFSDFSSFERYAADTIAEEMMLKANDPWWKKIWAQKVAQMLQGEKELLGRWFPNLLPSWLDSHGPVPRWVYHPGSMSPGRFIPRLLTNVRLNDFLNGLRRVYGVVAKPGGKHWKLIFPNGQTLPFPNRTEVPVYLPREIAQKLGIDRRELLRRCLDIAI